MNDNLPTVRMESFLYHDAPQITRTLAPYAGQLIVGFQTHAKGIANKLREDSSSLDALLQTFHDIAHGLLHDQEINHSDFVHVCEYIDALRQEIIGPVAEHLTQDEGGALEAA